jgi:hypothetical protein
MSGANNMLKKEARLERGASVESFLEPTSAI